MSDAIDQYLARLERQLWLRRRYRREVLEEMRSHLSRLADRDGAFTDLAELERRFGEPSTLAGSIVSARPFWQTTQPAIPIGLLLAAFIVANVACGFVSAWFHALSWLGGWTFYGAAAVGAVIIARRPVHAAQIFLSALAPALLFATVWTVLAAVLFRALDSRIVSITVDLFARLGCIAVPSLALAVIPWWCRKHPPGVPMRVALLALPIALDTAYRAMRGVYAHPSAHEILAPLLMLAIAWATLQASRRIGSDPGTHPQTA